jgi:hypothetical protein
MLVATAVLVCGLCAHFLAVTGPLPGWRAMLTLPEAPQARVEDAADEAEAGEMPEAPDGVRGGIATPVSDRQCGHPPLGSRRLCYAAD